MTDLLEQPPTLAARREALLLRLANFRRRIIHHLLFAGMVRVLAEGVLFLLATVLIDRGLRLGLTSRLFVLLVGLVGLARELWQRIILPLSLQEDTVGLAAAIDHVRVGEKALAPRVATVLELPQLLKADSSHSSAMVEQAVVHADNLLRETDFEASLDINRHRRHFHAMLVILAISILLILLNLHTTGLWARRWFMGSNEPWPQATYLAVAGETDGAIVVPRGEPFTLRISALPGSKAPEGITLRLRETNGPKVTAAMAKFAENDFRYDLPAVQSTVTLEADGGDDSIGPVRIEPVDRPKIKSLELTSQHPTETQPQNHLFTGQETDLTFLPKTQLTLTLQANVPLAEAKISGAPAEVKRLADDRFSITWSHQKPLSMQIELVSAQAKLTSLPTPVSIGLKVDQPPRVTLAFSGVRQRITPMAKIPLTIIARDDAGVASIGLVAKADFLDAEKKPQTINQFKPLFGPAKPATETELQQKPTFDVTGLKIVAGTILSLSASASDDRYESPQTGISRPANFRIVAPEELFREILLRQQGDRAKFRKQIEEATKIRESVSTLSGADVGGALARQHRSVQREVQRIGSNLADSMLEMRLNALGTPEAFDLMEKNVLAPLKKMDTELMILQRDALDRLASESGNLEAIAGRQDQIVTTLQQILKQMSQWDSFVDVLNQLNEIIRMQEGVKVGTDGIKSKQTEDIFDK